MPPNEPNLRNAADEILLRPTAVFTSTPMRGGPVTARIDELSLQIDTRKMLEKEVQKEIDQLPSSDYLARHQRRLEGDLIKEQTSLARVNEKLPKLQEQLQGAKRALAEAQEVQKEAQSRPQPRTMSAVHQLAARIETTRRKKLIGKVAQLTDDVRTEEILQDGGLRRIEKLEGELASLAQEPIFRESLERKLADIRRGRQEKEAALSGLIELRERGSPDLSQTSLDSVSVGPEAATSPSSNRDSAVQSPALFETMMTGHKRRQAETLSSLSSSATSAYIPTPPSRGASSRSASLAASSGELSPAFSPVPPKTGRPSARPGNALGR